MIDKVYDLIVQHYKDTGKKPTHLIVSYEVYQVMRTMAMEFQSKYYTVKPDEEPDRFMGLEVSISTKQSKVIMEVV